MKVLKISYITIILIVASCTTNKNNEITINDLNVSHQNVISMNEPTFYSDFDFFKGNLKGKINNNNSLPFISALETDDGAIEMTIFSTEYRVPYSKLLRVENNITYSSWNYNERGGTTMIREYYFDDKVVQIETFKEMSSDILVLKSVDHFNKTEKNLITREMKAYESEEIIVSDSYGYDELIEMTHGVEEDVRWVYSYKMIDSKLDVHRIHYDYKGDIILDENDCYDIEGYSFFWYLIFGEKMSC